MTTDTQPTHIELRDEAGPIAEVVAVGTVRAAEVVAAGLILLLVCPPLMILLVVVVAPLAAIALVVGAIAGVLALPVLAWRHLHRRHDHHLALVLRRYLHLRARGAATTGQ